MIKVKKVHFLRSYVWFQGLTLALVVRKTWLEAVMRRGAPVDEGTWAKIYFPSATG